MEHREHERIFFDFSSICIIPVLQHSITPGFDKGRELRLGILGGTFDPIHLGHLRVAEEIGEELQLERIYLLPAAVPPHKEARPITPFHHRLAMTQLAAEESPMLEVCYH